MMLTSEGQTISTSQVEAVLEGSASKSDWAAIRRCHIVVVPLHWQGKQDNLEDDVVQGLNECELVPGRSLLQRLPLRTAARH